MPKITSDLKYSVCIPTFNQAEYIERSILSANNQTIKPFEIIVSNDCSTDNTLLVLEQLAGKIKNLIILNQPFNLGISKNVDTCLRAATSDFIIRLDSDDILQENYAELLLETMLVNSNCAYAHAAVQEIDHNGRFLKKRFLARKNGIQDAKSALKGSCSGYRVAANIIMFRKSSLQKVGYIQSNTNFGEDYYLAVSLSSYGFDNFYLNKILSFYRIWNDSNNIRKKRKLDEINGYCKIFEEVLEPAFLKYEIDINLIYRAKTKLACLHSSCLSWDFYTAKEKIELYNALSKLTKSRWFFLTAWLYKNKLGFILQLINKSKQITLIILKQIYLFNKK